MLKKIVSSLFGSSKGETSVLDIADRLTSSESSLERKHQLALMSRGANTRLFIVRATVPFAGALITIMLVCEVFSIELNDNFYSVVEQVMYLLGLIFGFYFYYGAQSAKVAEKMSTAISKPPKKKSKQSITPSPNQPQRPAIKRDRSEDFDYVNEFNNES